MSLVKQRKQNKRNGQNGAIVVSPNAMKYTGPTRIVPTVGGSPKDDIVTQVVLIGAVASAVSGEIATVFDAYSQASSSPQWASYLALYGEYRILSMDLEFTPWNRYNLPTTTNVAPVYSVEDRENATALTSLNQASFYQTLMVHQPSTHFRRTVRMEGSGEADFTASSSTPNSDDRFYIKLYSAGNTASITLYDFCARCMVQFRNRKP